MIHYALRCADGHRFGSWFQSGSAFDSLHAAGHLSCAVCGSPQVDKTLMAPRLSTAAAPAPSIDADPPAPGPGALSKPRNPQEAALVALQERLERETDDVGADFAREARAMHEGTAPTRAIRGEALRTEAKALLDDGVPIVPLPVIPKSRTN